MTRRLVVDVENSVTKPSSGGVDNRPYNSNNELVSIGVVDIDTGAVSYVCVYHEEKDPDLAGLKMVKELIEGADLIVGHNIKYDLQWLWAVGIRYSGKIHDTMATEYILHRGIRKGLSLGAICEYRDLDIKKSDITKEYWDRGIGYEAMPWSVVKEYGTADILSTRELYLKQVEDLEGTSLQKTVDLTNEMCMCLSEIEKSGMYIDMDVLDKVEFDYRVEKKALERRLKFLVNTYMGDTPVNLSSPEQLSSMIFSRSPKDKKRHKEFFQLERSFRPSVSASKFKAYLSSGCTIVTRTESNVCSDCRGNGKVLRVKKDGNPYKSANICGGCGGDGVVYRSTGQIGGFKINPPDSQWATMNGFSTDKQRLRILASQLRAKSPDTYSDAIEFLEKVERLGAIETYLSSFVEGIRKRAIPSRSTVIGGSTSVNRMYTLYAEFNQCRTATGRLSSSRPNMQNMPRGGTFPVKKAFVSRFGDHGMLMEFDFAQLEFRAAAYLSDDAVAKEEIDTGFDVHTYTADFLTKMGQSTSRQEAKSRTFAPLYGAMNGSPAEKAYNVHFIDKYNGIKDWHRRLQDDAIRNKSIVLPTGRVFSFPDAKRNRNGGATGATKIKNYPVQSFATADIVPLCLVNLREALRWRGLNSSIVNTVHDSVLLDCMEDEVPVIKRILEVEFSTDSIRQMIEDFYGFDMNVPLSIDTKKGENWLDMA
tara:strand:+ start:455 stop:2569 length:2115 start_codon:yes stop_codon:yes gene_type:complete